MKYRVFIAAVVLLLSGYARAGEVVMVPITGVIDGGLAEFVKRSVGEAETSGADAIVFRINTPGGRIDSAVDIKDAILAARPLTVAFIDRNAISAGALISFACDSLYMTTGASIGAATAVDLEGNKASEKMISYFRAQMRATAEATGKRPDIAEAMVDEDIVIEGISPPGKLLTLTYTEALETGVSNATVESLDDVMRLIGRSDDTVRALHINWAERIVRILTHPVVSSLLMSIGFLGLLIEIRTPGWGLGGTIALVALALFFGSHYIVRLAGVGELMLFAAGIILLVLEVFVIPGFGITGISGTVLIVLSLYLSLVGRMPLAGDMIRAGYTVAVAFALTVMGTFVVIRLFPHLPFYGRLMLNATERAADGYRSSDDSVSFIGAEGVALTTLRPAGTAMIAGTRMDVVSEGGYIEKGARIVVIEGHGSRIVVRDAGV